jgi:hypothetical protein
MRRHVDDGISFNKKSAAFLISFSVVRDSNQLMNWAAI